MKKPEGLRRVLLRWVPGLQDKSDNLSLFVDKGRIRARNTGNLSFEYRYTLHLVFQDYAGDTASIVVPLLAWIAEQQPELLEKGEPFTFEAELLDSELRDVAIDLELSELVEVTAAAEGGYAVTYREEPNLTDHFPGVCAAPFWTGFLGVDVVARTSDPAADA